MEKLQLSYSQISLFLDRPVAWYLSHVKKVEVPLALALFVGGTFHLTYNLYYSNKLENSNLSLEDCIDIGASLWDTRAFSTRENKDIAWGAAKPDEERNKFLALVKVYYPLASSIIPSSSEQMFTKVMPDDIELRGVIDLIDNKGNPIDLKTANRLPYKDKLDWDMQPTSYATILGAKTLPSFIYHYTIKASVPYTRVVKTFRNTEIIRWFSELLIPRVASLIRAGIYVCDMTKCRACDFYIAGKCGPR